MLGRKKNPTVTAETRTRFHPFYTFPSTESGGRTTMAKEAIAILAKRRKKDSNPKLEEEICCNSEKKKQRSKGAYKKMNFYQVLYHWQFLKLHSITGKIRCAKTAIWRVLPLMKLIQGANPLFGILALKSTLYIVPYYLNDMTVLLKISIDCLKALKKTRLASNN